MYFSRHLQFFGILHLNRSQLSYLFIDIIFSNYILTFVLVVIFDALDFWTVKNITGRKLVGLRWWSQIRDDGTEVWLYETMGANFKPNEYNSN
jgi:hypothetical protein